MALSILKIKLTQGRDSLVQPVDEIQFRVYSADDEGSLCPAPKFMSLSAILISLSLEQRYQTDCLVR